MFQWVYSPRIEETAASNVRAGRSNGWLRSWSEERRHHKLRRDAIATLLRVDDDVLRDITGLERHQVEAASRMPLEVDALKLLEEMQRRRPASEGGGTD